MKTFALSSDRLVTKFSAVCERKKRNKKEKTYSEYQMGDKFGKLSSQVYWYNAGPI